MITGCCRVLWVVIFLSLATAATAIDNSWYFTAEQIDVAYRYQQNFGRRLRSPLKPHDCYHGKTEFVAWFKGTEFDAPCQFVHQTTRHLKTMLEKGAARYLFPLDADHAHLAVPLDLWRDVYSGLDFQQLVPRVLSEPALVALYHTAEHLSVVDRNDAPVSAQVKNWKAQRNHLPSMTAVRSKSCRRTLTARGMSGSKIIRRF